jgi:hypothetical protein
MILAAHQPAYLPWLGYLEKIARADVMVHLDNVQFERGGHTHRNRIKTPSGPLWLTVPVHARGHLETTIRDLAIDSARDWRGKHLKSIAQNYRRAPRFDHCFPRLEQLLANGETSLDALCWAQLVFWAAEFGITTRVVRLSELPVTSTKSDLVLDLCQHLGATHYLSGALGRNYLNEAAFRDAGITIEYQDFVSPVYPQLWGDFVPNLSVVDFWMNCEPSTLRFERSTL